MREAFYMQGRKIYQHSRRKKQPDGKESVSLATPVCEVDEFVKNPEVMLEMLNAHGPMLQALEGGYQLMMYGLKMMEAELKIYPHGDIQQEDILAAMNACVNANTAIRLGRGAA